MMAWKHDLAKIKKEIKETEDLKPKAPIPKAGVKPEKPLELQDEDAVFLLAMGKKPRQAKSVMETIQENPVQVSDNLFKEAFKEPSAEEDFQSAMHSLKGLKGQKEKALGRAVEIAPVALAGESPLSNAGQEEKKTEVGQKETPFQSTQDKKSSEIQPLQELKDFPKKKGEVQALPNLIHLAAGMAVDVDGCLDLRGHSLNDAMERLKERIQDGVFLGWRNLHVMLGHSEELQGAFQSYINSEEAGALSRYAQAPVPMGGSQAWILYYPSH